MSLNLLGIDISPNEITNIGPLGFWLLIDETEYFVPFEDYPRFKQARVFEIFNLQRLSPDQFHWPDLDIDIELDALKTPEKYPLAWKDEK